MAKTKTAQRPGRRSSPRKATRTRKTPARRTKRPAQGRPVGRPSLFTPEIRQTVLDAARMGNYAKTCAAFAGIGVSTLNDWLARGEKIAQALPDDDAERTKALAALPDLDREFVEFSAAYQKDRASAEIEAVAGIRDAARGRDGETVRLADGTQRTIPAQDPVWQAHAWFLERSFPDRWGRRRVEIVGADGGPVQVTHGTISDEERTARLQRLMATKGDRSQRAIALEE